MLHVRRWPLLVMLVLLAGSVSIAVGDAGHSRTAPPLEEAAIAHPGAGFERAVLAAKPGAELERLRTQANPRYWGWVLAAVLALVALAGRPGMVSRRSPHSASPRRAGFASVRPSRAPPRLLLIPS